MSETEGRFACVHRGAGITARVTVQVDPQAPAPSIRLACSGSGFTSQGHIEDVSADGYDDWKAGAVAGVRYALRFVGHPEYGVVITRILGLGTDTTAGAVGVAAAMAVWAALGFQPPAEEVQRLKDVVIRHRVPSDSVPDFG